MVQIHGKGNIYYDSYDLGIYKISVVMIITGVLKVFDMVFVMTEGGPNGLTHVPATLLYSQAFKYNHYGIGSAISTVMFLMSLALTIISLKIMNRDDEKKEKERRE